MAFFNPPGPGEMFLLLLLSAIPLWAIISAALTPESVWRASGRSKTGWVVALALTAVLGFGVIVALIYLVGVRPSLKRRLKDSRVGGPTFTT